MLSFRSLKSRLFILLFLIALPGIAIIFFEAHLHRHNIIEHAKQRALATAYQLVLTQKSIINNTQTYLKYLAQSPQVQDPTNPKCSYFLQNVLPLNPLYVNVGIPLANGDLLCNAIKLNKKVNVFDREYFQQSLTNKSFAIGKLQFDRASHKTSVNFSYPVFAKQAAPHKQQVTAVAVAVVSLEWWSRQLESASLPRDSIAKIFDYDGNTVASYPLKDDSLGLARTTFNFTKNANSADDLQSEIIIDEQGVERVFTHALLYQASKEQFVTVSIGIPINEATEIANRQFSYILITFFLAILIISLITVRVLKLSIIEPLEILSQATALLESGQFAKIKISDYTIREVKQLQLKFKQMAKKRLEVEREKNSRNEELNSVFKALPDHLYRINGEGIILDSKGKTALSQEYSNNKVIGSHIQNIYPSDVANLFVKMLNKQVNNHQHSSWEYSLDMGSETQTFEARISAIENSSEFIIVIRNITARKKTDALIWQQANLDPLTHLPNRNLLYNQLISAIDFATTKRTRIAVLFLDLDQFKDVNDTLGHQAGDILLKQASNRLSSCIRANDTLARQGGDEFTILLGDLETKDYLSIINTITDRILQSLSEPYYLGDDIAYVTASIGIALYPNDAVLIDDLFRMADQAMYVAKLAGRNKALYFTESMQQNAQERMTVINDLRIAIQEQQFVLYYQPIIELNTGELHKAEALIRWQHPTKGLVAPDSFIQIAEETHLIVAIGDWVFNQAIANLVTLSKTLQRPFQTSINVSPIQFSNSQSNLRNWGDKIKQAELCPQSIVIEITESLLMEASSEIASTLNKFSELGIEVAIDDFGTGYSSLSYIREYDVDYLKIDRSFITNLRPESDSLALCEAIVVMAHKLGICVIAEGIETVEQQELLKSIGCDYGQGYLYSKPVDIDTFQQRFIN